MTPPTNSKVPLQDTPLDLGKYEWDYGWCHLQILWCNYVCSLGNSTRPLRQKKFCRNLPGFGLPTSIFKTNNAFNSAGISVLLQVNLGKRDDKSFFKVCCVLTLSPSSCHFNFTLEYISFKPSHTLSPGGGT